MSSITLPLLAAGRRRRLFRAVLFLIGAAAALLALGIGARAADGHILIVPADDGYGFSECLNVKSACGAIVADAWCAANGLKSSTGFGRAEDVAPDEGAAETAPGAFFVACGDKI